MRPEKRIALVSFDVPVAGSMSTFSYSVHKLQASLASCPGLDDVEVRVITMQTGDPAEILEALVEFRPTLIGCTLYVWSLAPFRELAAAHKRIAPEVPIVVGGPSARKNVFDLAPYASLRDTVDAMVPGEGEEVIRELARHHLEPDWRERVQGLFVPKDGEWVPNEEAPRPQVDEYPSPYHLGTAPMGRTGFIETFRGCPITCSFCQWGGVSLGGIHSPEYLAGHLRGLAASEAKNVFFLDAAFNLNPRAFRNLVEAEKEVGALREMVVFGHLYPTFVKEIHLEFFQSLGRVHPAIGVQSFEPEVLRRIGRPFDLERFDRVLDALRGKVGIDIELILGLPGDDPISFRKTLDRAIEVGDAVRISYCMVLPDALLDRARPDDGLEFDPETFYLRSCAGWTPEDLDREWQYVHDVAAQFHQQEIEESLIGFQVYETSRVTEPWSTQGPEPERETSPPEVRAVGSALLDRLCAAAEGTGFAVEGARLERGAMLLEVVGATGAVVIEACPAEPGGRHFVRHDRVAYSHRGPLARADAAPVKALIARLHEAIAPAVEDADLVQLALQKPA